MYGTYAYTALFPQVGTETVLVGASCVGWDVTDFHAQLFMHRDFEFLSVSGVTRDLLSVLNMHSSSQVWAFNHTNFVSATHFASATSPTDTA